MDKEGWELCLKAVKGNIYNCYSKEDDVLGVLYQLATAFISKPIGLGNIAYDNHQIINKDVSHLVKGHMEYKTNFKMILKDI